MHPRSTAPTFSERLATRLSPDRLLWAVWVRWLVIAGFLTLAVVAHACGLFASIVPVAQVAVIGSVLNALNDWCVRRGRSVVAVTSVAIPMDHLLSTYLVVNSGGVRSPFMMLYIVQVLATAMLVDTRIAAGSAGLAILLWSAGVSLHAAGYLDAPPVFVPGAAQTGEALYRGAWAAFFLYCLALLVYLGGYISERLRTSERDLADKNRRLEEALASVRAAHEQLGEAYERLKQTETQLVHAEKMRSLGVLMAGIAHELNNPISFVAANIEHLRRFTERLRQALDLYTNAPLPPAIALQATALRRELRLDQVLADLPGVLDDCEEGARRTTQIVSELRSFARSDERGWRPADLHRGIDSTLRLLAPQLTQAITVHRDFDDLPDVDCLPGQMNQVFLNLLANAAGALGRHPGTIWITTRRLDDGPQPHVRVAIRDDGPGMTPELQARIFEPFFTTKDIGQGTGLGLSVSYAIVQRHRGTLTVESAPGAGATFTITLPVRRNEL